jgi:hypothetical protein
MISARDTGRFYDPCGYRLQRFLLKFSAEVSWEISERG